MNPLKEFFESGQTILWIETQNTVAFLRPLAVGDVDHGSHEFDEITGRAENRMSSGVNVPDGAILMHEAVVRFKLDLLTDHPLHQFFQLGLVIRMNPLEQFFESGQTIP